MPKHIVSYELPYVHTVAVGIQAATPEQAIEQAQALFDAGDIWDDTAAVPLLRDDFDEDTDCGATLKFTVEQTLDDDADYPEADGSVKRLRRDAAARAAAQALIEAYEKAGEDGSTSVDWSDIDLAHELAIQAARR